MNLPLASFLICLLAITVHSNVIIALIASVVLFCVFYSFWTENPVIAPNITHQYGLLNELVVNFLFWIIFALLQIPTIHNFTHAYADFLFPRH